MDYNLILLIITATKVSGNVISWSSSGSCKFKGYQKTTPFAAKEVVFKAFKKGIDYEFNSVIVKFKGPGNGREMIIKTIQKMNLNICSIKDITPLPHNGCRPSKKRRL